MVDRLAHLDDELDRLAGIGQLRSLRIIEGSASTVARVDGYRALNFSSNNYLGLADHPALRDAAVQAITDEGFGAGASRLISGNLASHRRLEEALARFHEVHAALVFGSGYQANVGVLSALAGPDDLVVSDALNHASLIDGCRLSRAHVQVYPHASVAAAERALIEGVHARRRFIVTDSVFSMTGAIAPLAELRALADRYDAFLIVDEAHATGILGPGGRGACAAAGVRPDVHVGTLSKALGAYGAYVAGDATLIEYLTNTARSFVFTTALPPSTSAAALTALQLAAGPRGDQLRVALRERLAELLAGFDSVGLHVPPTGTPIVPVILGDADRTMETSQRLLELGVFAQGIRPPTVPPGSCRLRFSVMATHSSMDIATAVAAVAELVHEGLIPRS